MQTKNLVSGIFTVYIAAEALPFLVEEITPTLATIIRVVAVLVSCYYTESVLQKRLARLKNRYENRTR